MENKSFRPHDRRKIKRPPSTSAQEATSILARHPRANFSPPSWRKRCNYRARFFPRFWPCHARVLVLPPPPSPPPSPSPPLSLSRMDVQGLEAENTKGWLRVHRISEFAVYLAADAAGREGRGTRRKGGFVHRVRGGGRRVGSKDEGKKREKTVRSW